jgi:hypothetical protein
MKTGVIENECFTVTLDPARGGISSIVDKRSRRELVDQNSGYTLGQYLYERFDANQVAAYTKAYVKNRSDWAVAELGKPVMPPASQVPYRAASPRYDGVLFAQSPVSVSATMYAGPTASLLHGVTTKVILYADEPYLDLEVTLHDKPANDWPEAGWICLPVNVEKPQFRLGRLGGIADPARDFARGSNHDLQAVNTGVTISDTEGHGVGICPLDSPLVSLDRPGLFRYSPISCRAGRWHSSISTTSDHQLPSGTKARGRCGSPRALRARASCPCVFRGEGVLPRIAGRMPRHTRPGRPATSLTTPALERDTALAARRMEAGRCPPPKRRGAVDTRHSRDGVRPEPGRPRHSPAAVGARGGSRSL